jgi:serine/threonine protein kinase
MRLDTQPHDPADIVQSTARRVAAVRARRAARQEIPLIPGWVSEHTLAVGEEAHIVRVHRFGDRERRPFVAKVLRSMGPDGQPRDVDEQRMRLLREIDALRALGSLGCPGIVRVITFGMSAQHDASPWYIMPYYAGGAMWTDDDVGGRWSEDYRGRIDRVLSIAEGVASTLAFMHDGPRRCVHGHVVAGNVLLTAVGGRPVLGDFGYSSLAGSPFGAHAADVVEHWCWRAPELTHDGAAASPASDVFMLGGLIYEALSGGRRLPPASGWPEPSVHERREHSLLRDSTDPRIGAVSALLGRMLVTNPALRLSARQVARACRGIRTGTSVGGRALRGE